MVPEEVSRKMEGKPYRKGGKEGFVKPEVSERGGGTLQGGRKSSITSKQRERRGRVRWEKGVRHW